MKPIGPSFYSELVAAVVDLNGVAWAASGEIFFNEGVSAEQRAAVSAVLSEHDPSVPAPAAVPESVTKYQCCVALARYDLLAPTNAFFTAMAEDDPRRLAWEMAATVQRHSDSTMAAVAHLGLSEAQADAMFIEADQVD